MTRGRLAAGTGLSLGAALGMSATAEAADFTVTNISDGAAPGPAGSLRRAVSDANLAVGPDRVLFQSGLSGTITLTNGQIAIDEALEIAGPGRDMLTISGGGASRIFYSYPAPLAQPAEAVTITGLKLTGGNPGASSGGAIRGMNAVITISDSVLSGNTGSGGGGAVYAYQGKVSVLASTISGNSATPAAGGAIRTFSGPVTVQESTVSGNSAGGGGGGGIYTYQDELLVMDSTVSGNTSVGAGGGIRTFSTPTTLVRSTVSGNSQSNTGGGGGVYLYSDSLTSQSSTISANTSGGNGGAIRTFKSAIAIEASTISGNSSTGVGHDGGGLYLYGPAPISFQSSTLAGNTAADQGGGIYRFPGPNPTLTNTIVADNTAATRPDLSGTFNATFSLIESTAGATIGGAGPNVTGQDPKLAPLGDNGGPTQTRALLLGSPALDRGLATRADQRGAPRPFDLEGVALAVGGNASDIGAYERSLCGGKLVNRVGTSGADVLRGTKASDGMLALSGKDKLKGGAGRDGLCGGPGPDKLKGGGGNDKLLGQAGADSLIGGKGKDVLKGGKGKDKQKQ